MVYSETYAVVDRAIEEGKYLLKEASLTKSNNRHYTVIIEIKWDDAFDPKGLKYYNGKSQCIHEFISDDKKQYKYLVIRNVDYDKKENVFTVTMESYDYKEI